MKQLILFLMVFILAVSCGGKGDTGKASFKLSLGKMSNASASYFNGGLLILGHRLDETQSFSLAYTDGLQLDLQKGAWEFATIGWTLASSGQMTGPQQCSYQYVELRDDNQSINFSMSPDNCRSLKTSMNDQFADSQFIKLTNASGTIGFKRLHISVCSSVDAVGTCNFASGSSTINSFKVSIPATVKGVSVTSAPALTSNCVQIISGNASSDLTLPLGGKSGFIKMNIGIYNSADCSGTPAIHTYNHGFGEVQTGFSITSSSINLTGASAVNYVGDWAGLTVPLNSGYLKGDIFHVTSNISALSATPGDTIYFNGSSWVNYISPVTVINGMPYFDNELFAYMFIKQ
ncbi:MAG: hypothetical protein H7336_05340 [Bacteriovorax sp.]|nr:hypothetical protein [Bacteriovorax sp.]